MKSVRSFFAIPLSETAQEQVSHILHHLKKEYQKEDYIRWISPENLHITVCFLGQVNLLFLPALIDLVKQKLSIIKSFHIELQNIQFFPSLKRPQVIALAIAPNPELMQLAHVVQQSATSLDLSIDARPYRPHLTLGRIKTSHINQPLYAPIPTPITLEVKSLILYGSHLTPKSSHYSTLAQLSFGTSANSTPKTEE